MCQKITLWFFYLGSFLQLILHTLAPLSVIDVSGYERQTNSWFKWNQDSDYLEHFLLDDDCKDESFDPIRCESGNATRIFTVASFIIFVAALAVRCQAKLNCIMVILVVIWQCIGVFSNALWISKAYDFEDSYNSSADVSVDNSGIYISLGINFILVILLCWKSYNHYTGKSSGDAGMFELV